MLFHQFNVINKAKAFIKLETHVGTTDSSYEYQFVN